MNTTININNSPKDKTDNIIKPNLTQNYDLNQNNQSSNKNYNLCERISNISKLKSNQNNSTKNKKIIKFSKSNKVIEDSILGKNIAGENNQKKEANKGKNIKKIFSAFKSKPKAIQKLQLNNKSIKFDLNV